jgi:hypothetical protein
MRIDRIPDKAAAAFPARERQKLSAAMASARLGLTNSPRSMRIVASACFLLRPAARRSWMVSAMGLPPGGGSGCHFPVRPWRKGGNPKMAVQEYLKNHSEFEFVQTVHEKLLVTVPPDGHLKRVR